MNCPNTPPLPGRLGSQEDRLHEIGKEWGNMREFYNVLSWAATNDRHSRSLLEEALGQERTRLAISSWKSQTEG